MARRGVRLSAGMLKGRSLAVPPGVRPTEGRVREALFDILGPALAGKSFLDLFAGSGAVGLEAVSRGAAAVCQVDVDPNVIRGLVAAYREFGLDGIECHRLDLPARLSSLAPRRFDRVFADPPYDFGHYDELVAALPAVLEPGGVAVIEHRTAVEPPPAAAGMKLGESRRYGGSVLSFYEASVSTRER